MIAIYAEKPDMGTKIAAALFGIPLENGVVVTFSQLEKYERQIKAQRTKNGYFKIRYQGQEAYVTWGYGHMCTLKELPDIEDIGSVINDDIEAETSGEEQDPVSAGQMTIEF